MSRITQRLDTLKAEKRKALVIFITAGDPSSKMTERLVKTAYDNGADIVELGVPFSDPLADGPVIQASFHRAIAKGANLTKTLKTVELIRTTCDVPIVFMLASTLVFNHGVKKFMSACKSSGVDGLIIPDMPPEDSEEFIPPARANGLDTIFLAAPTSTPKRLKRIVSLSRGFVYYISVKGVTGGASATAREISSSISKIKKMTKLPVLAGFGVKTPDQARALSRSADGVIIGSKAVELINATRTSDDAVKSLARYVRSVRKEMDRK